MWKAKKFNSWKSYQIFKNNNYKIRLISEKVVTHRTVNITIYIKGGNCCFLKAMWRLLYRATSSRPFFSCFFIWLIYLDFVMQACNTRFNCFSSCNCFIHNFLVQKKLEYFLDRFKKMLGITMKIKWESI